MGVENEEFSAEGSIARFYVPSGAAKASAEYHVALFIYDGKRAVIIGNLYSVDEKEKIVVHGEWVEHYKYGRQVKVKSWERPIPSTEEQAILFLSSRLVKGVGPATAKKIVGKLGADAVKVIMEKGIKALDGIKGLRNAQKICDSIQETYQMQRVISQLLSLGISVNTSIRAYKKFGSPTVELVKKNPYCLMDVDKIGFQTADTIAKKLNITPDSTGRIAGAIKYTIEEYLWGHGHCYLMVEDLARKTLKLLNRKAQSVTLEKVETIINHLSVTNRLVIETGAVYLPRLYQSEVSLAKKVKAIMGRPVNKVPAAKIERIIKQYELQEGIRLADEQKEAVTSFINSNFMILTGGPGVGKTTTVKAIIGVYEKLYDEEICLAAPTGKASRRLSEVTGKEAVTIHRLLGFNPEMQGPAHNCDEPLPCGLLVVDEGSMMGVRIADLVFDAVARSTRVLLVGDADQLSSVEPGNVLRDLLDAGVPSVRLEKVFRQASQSQIITGAHKINTGKAFYPDHSRGDFYFIEKEDPVQIAQLIVACVGRLLQLDFTLDDVQVLCPMKKGPVGTSTLNKLQQNRLNPAGQGRKEINRDGVEPVIFRTGDRVICVRNNYEKGEYGVFNGETGIITRMLENDDGEITGLAVSFDQGEIEYEKRELYDLELAYAITAHKSQGSEFKAVIIPLTTSNYTMLSRMLIYTAVTRAKERVVLVGTKKAYWMAVKNDKSERNTRLTARIKDVAYLDIQTGVRYQSKEEQYLYTS